MDTYLLGLIEIIKTGTPLEIKSAQKNVEKIWHQACEKRDLRKSFFVFMQEAQTFSEISDTDHKVYFINTLKWPLWFLELENFYFWLDFLLCQVQNQQGKIRIAVVRASQYMHIAISMYFNPHLSTDGEKAQIAKNYFGYWVMCVKTLIEKYHKPFFNRYKYVDSLPSCTYKSLNQMLYILLASDYFEDIYRKFYADRENISA